MSTNRSNDAAIRETESAQLKKIADEGHRQDDIEKGFIAWMENWRQFLEFYNKKFTPLHI